MQNAKIAFIGAGNMGAALIGGLLNSLYPKSLITASNPENEIINKLKQQFDIEVFQNNLTAAKAADVIILTVKPQIIKDVVLELKDYLVSKQPLIISIAAGAPIQLIQKLLTKPMPIIRVMPNTPALIGFGAAGMFANKQVTKQQKEIAEKILKAVGIVVWVKKESDIDTITALSGSGPAYFYLMMESLINDAMKFGLDEETARQLTLQTALGAAKMAIETKISPTILREQVTSPNGTTEAALKVLKQQHFTEIIAEAVKQAKKRAEEIAQELG